MGRNYLLLGKANYIFAGINGGGGNMWKNLSSCLVVLVRLRQSSFANLAAYVDGISFDRAGFSIWMGADPIDTKFRDLLLSDS
jgi:hypothetical protein